ncbi:type IV pilus twitching motility protein PilT [Thalassospira xianhensis]|uniref:type IV pilus twitching motility protein PilT n=1 Tax=Thalassospira xianhensis TaxID=478503 RepID=UPI001ABFAA2F|nr:ATPase, T2SS/T4P/T4SS family [Thalassospira xianhensis]
MFEFVGQFNEETLDEFLIWCTEKRVSDITLQSDVVAWGKVGGKWQRLTTRRINHDDMYRVVVAVYGQNGPGEVNSGHDLDPLYEIRDPNGVGRYSFRVNVTGGRLENGRGYQVTIRTLPSEPIKLELLGIEDDIVKAFRPEQGLNLITGPTGSGKSTLLSSLIRNHCEREDVSDKVIEYSRPIEYVYDGLHFPHSFVFQTEVGQHLRDRYGDDSEMSDWAYAARNALRRAADIIVIGEARDAATIRGCMTLASTGHLSMSTMHTIGVAETIRRALMVFPGNEQHGVAIDLLECLNLVVTQLLIPKIGGGMVGCREYLVFDAKIRTRLSYMPITEWPQTIREILQARTSIGSSMEDSARQLHKEGKITAETFEYIAQRSSSESEVTRKASLFKPDTAETSPLSGFAQTVTSSVSEAR